MAGSGAGQMRGFDTAEAAREAAKVDGIGLVDNLGSVLEGATAVFTMLLNLYRPLNILGWAWREIKQGAVDLEKLYGLMGMVPEVADKPDAADLGRAAGHVQFEDVSFAHEGRTVGVEGIDMDIPAGGSVAFVGTSGAGKSTLLKLLFRFYDVKSGRVLVDGQDAETIKHLLSKERLLTLDHNRSGAKVFTAMADVAPATISAESGQAACDWLQQAARAALAVIHF